jgi:hypothetical protein
LRVGQRPERVGGWFGVVHGLSACEGWDGLTAKYTSVHDVFLARFLSTRGG